MQAPIPIQALFEELEITAEQAKRGPYNWEIRQGSAKIDIAYHEKSGLIIGEAILCKVPSELTSPLYEYLLIENDKLEGLSFSINAQEVLLTLLIHDKQFNTLKVKRLFRSLLERADYYDNVLVEQYGAQWLKPEDF